MKLCGWWASFVHSPAVEQTSLNSLKWGCPLNEEDKHFTHLQTKIQIVEQNEEGAYTSGSTTTLIVEQSVEGAHSSDVTRKQILE